MTLSIRWKVTLGTLLAVTCGLVIAGIMAIQSLERQETAQLNEVLTARTKLVEYGLQPLFHSPSLRPTQTRLQEVVRDLGSRALARVTLVAADGTVIADSAVRDVDLSAVENHLSRPEIQQALATGHGRDIRASHTTGERTMYRATVMTQPPDARPVIVRVGLPMVLLDREISKLKQNLLLALGVAFFVAVSLSIWLARSITRPLSDIALAAQRLAAGHQTVPIKTSSRDEVGLLAATLNHMADQLHAKINELSEDRAQLLAMLTSMVEGVMVLDYRG
ncbi:MAG TPA: HAMP domain-containing protein, partial [Nitrospiraceae bacterium]|nr:HAMP domain-containing protein [Nitrospiraceae bacterium]